MFTFSIVPVASAVQTTFGFVAGGAIGAVLTRATGWMRATSVSLPNDGSVERRVKTGRLSLPQSAAELSAGEGPALERITEFVDQLAELPLSNWIDIGRAIATDAAGLTARSNAWPILDATIGARGLRVTAWYVRDAVETAVFLAGGSTRHWTRAERSAFAGAHGAAEEAALALLVQASLSAADFDVFRAPFASIIPISATWRVTASAAVE